MIQKLNTPALYNPISLLLTLLGSWLLISHPPGTEAPYLSYLGWFLSLASMYLLSKSSFNYKTILFISSLQLMAFSFYPASDDVHRYLWEGHIQTQGFDPYTHSPDSKPLEHLQDENWKGINHKDLSAAYPPPVQILFRALSYSYPSLFAWRIFLGLLFLLSSFLIVKLLQREDIPSNRVSFFSNNPYPLIFLIGEAHFDAIMIPLLLGAYYCYKHQKHSLMWIWLGGAISLKYFPFILIPFFLRKENVKHIPFLLIPFLSFLPFYNSPIFKSLSTFGSNFVFNSPWHHIFHHQDLWHWILLGFIAFTLLLFHYMVEPILARNLAFGGMLLLSIMPTIHPWYFAIVIPWLCFHSQRPLWLWQSLIWCFLYPTYHNFAQGLPWQESSWSTPAIWIPFFLFVLWEFFKGGRPLAFIRSKKAIQSITIIIPVYNEETNLTDLKTKLIQAMGHTQAPIDYLLIDGSSTDNTKEKAISLNMPILNSPQKGRGYQIKHGIQSATSDLIIIAHADMDFNTNIFADIENLFHQYPGTQGGCCVMEFEDESQLHLVENLNSMRSRVLQLPFGDQMQFFRKELSPQINMPLMEDVEIAMSLKEYGSFKLCKSSLRVSSRRWKKVGRLKNTSVILQICFEYLLYRRSNSFPKDIMHFYKKYYS